MLIYCFKVCKLKNYYGNPIGRPKGSVSTTSKLIREHISQAIDGNKIMEMLDKIESPTEYINAISKLLPYSIGKVKPYEEIEERESTTATITANNIIVTGVILILSYH